MKAIHIEVPGHAPGSFALCFANAQSMGEFARAMLEQAHRGNCNIAFHTPGQSLEQMQLNLDMAVFEARCLPELEVGRIEAPRVTSKTRVSVPRRLGPAPSVAGAVERRPQIQIASQLGEVASKLGVVQPWDKQGIPESLWRRQHGWPER